jgi:hypothetical protein
MLILELVVQIFMVPSILLGPVGFPRFLQRRRFKNYGALKSYLNNGVKSERK